MTHPHDILFTSWYSGLGGGETDLITLARQFADTPYRPHLLLAHEGQLGAVWREMGLPVHIVPYRGVTTYFIPRLWMQLPSARRIAQIVHENRIRLIHSDYHPLPMATAGARQAGVPIVWTVHGWWFRPHWWQRGFFRRMDGTVARSHAIRDGFLGHPPFMPPARVPVVYSGVDTARFHPTIAGDDLRVELALVPTTPLVAMVARFQPVKGHHTFQALARLVARQHPDAHFVVAGGDVFGVAADEAYKQDILATARTDALLRDRLHYLGFRADVERVLASADVVVCPSQFESYGKVNLEAMACATAVVSTNQGGPRETVIDGETGFLVAPDDVQAFAERVCALLSDADQRQRMGQAGQQHVRQHFSAQATTAAYLRLFQNQLD